MMGINDEVCGQRECALFEAIAAQELVAKRLRRSCRPGAT
jgi:hypothetical protein